MLKHDAQTDKFIDLIFYRKAHEDDEEKTSMFSCALW
jgi:hypothetical protein